MHQLKKFPSGLSLITIPIPGIKTVTVMVLFKVGAKHENSKNKGISHFLEHMLFKGTKKRPSAKAVSEVLDEVGGEFNAFTGKEYTGYYAKVGSKNLALALDWTADIIISSTLDEAGLEKERGVIIEEMNMYKDTPTQHIHDVFEELVYGDQPAGWNIIGTRETVRKITREDIASYKNRNYTKKNCVVCIAGHFGKETEKMVKEYFGNLYETKPKVKLKTKEKQKNPKFRMEYKKTDQSHCILGFRAFNLFDKERYPLSVIATILGGGMSSRLFIKIREERGLAYYINADTQLYTDSGYLAIQAGLENSKFKKAVEIMLGECQKLTKTKVKEKELQKAKEYMKGHALIGMESSNAQAFYYGSKQLLQNENKTLEQEFKALDKVSAADVLKISEKIFTPNKLNLAVISPKRTIKGMERILKRWR